MQPSRGQCQGKASPTDTGEKKELFGFTASRWKTAVEGCGPKGGKGEIDGWYIPLQYASACKAADASQGPGFPLQYTATTIDEKGVSSTMEYEVESLYLTLSPLSEAMFEPPEDFKELSLEEALARRNPGFQRATSAPKQEGKVRVGVAAPVANAGVAVVGGLDSKLSAALNDPRIEAVPLGAGPPEAIEARAREAGFEYVLSTEVTELA